MAEEENNKTGPETKDIPGLPKEEEAALKAAAESQDSALKEALQLSSGRPADELRKDAERREHNRQQQFKDHFEILIKYGMNVAFAAVVIMGVVWVWHMIAPEHLRWLSEQDIDHIQGMVTGGVIAVVVGDHFKRRLGDSD